MRKIGGIVIVAASAVLMAQQHTDATPTLGATETWSTTTTEGWTSDPFFQSGVNSVVAGNLGQYLQITSDGAGFTPGTVGAISGPIIGDSYFKGDYTTLGQALVVKFQLNTYGAAPGDLALYFANTQNTDIWIYDIPVGNLVTGTTAYEVPIGTMGSWVGENGSFTSIQFMQDLAYVNYLGLYIAGSAANVGGNNEVYGLDNMDLTLDAPEPQSTSLILAVLLSMAMVFRGRLAEVAAKVRAKV